MKDIQIGQLIFTKKAVLLIAFRFFLLGMAIGVSVALKDEHANWALPIIFSGVILSLLTFRKTTAENIIDVNKTI